MATPEPETAVTAVGGGEALGGPSGDCGGTVTLVGTDAPIEAQMFGAKQYLCVHILEGVSQIVFELSGMTGALDLYVDYYGSEILEGGEDQFWVSEQPGRDDESIIIEPDATGFVGPGVYFIEISGGASADGASFVLTATTN
jgi:hypothetical protein